MTNTFLGLNASVYQLGEILVLLGQLEILWSFIAGFGLAVLMYAFLASMHPRATSPLAHVVPKQNVFGQIITALFALALLGFVVLALISTIRF